MTGQVLQILLFLIHGHFSCFGIKNLKEQNFNYAMLQFYVARVNAPIITDTWIIPTVALKGKTKS